MNKFIVVSNKKKSSFSEKLFKKFLDYDVFDILTGKQAEEVIKRETSAFLLLNIKQPANLDMMDRLSLGTVKGLRVTIFKIKPFTAKVLNFLLPFDLFELFSQDLQSVHHTSANNPSLQEK